MYVTDLKGITMIDKDIIKNVLVNMPSDWLRLTTHRLDLYNENLAKVEFLEKFESLVLSNKSNLSEELKQLPTSFDYIRLGHPLSCVLEWVIAKNKSLDVNNVISFASEVMPILAILRKNSLENIKTKILYTNSFSKILDVETLRIVYGYNFELTEFSDTDDLPSFDGSTILLTSFEEAKIVSRSHDLDFIINIDSNIGSVVQVYSQRSADYVAEIQHVRRRESIAMTPHDSLKVLETYTTDRLLENSETETSKDSLIRTIGEITNTSLAASIGSSGLSIQYALMMGLIHHSMDKNKGKKIKFIVPPNCYGGTNDQARRVAACIDNVEIVDLPVDGGKDMVEGVESILSKVALEDAVPFIIAEIPTNPRVEVPELEKLRLSLIKERKTSEGLRSVAPVFILDQTFCPNIKFLGENDFLAGTKTISYVSGSKFPSGGLCTAGYCVGNDKAREYMGYVDSHLKLCGNEATNFQIETLEKQMPSMIQRIDSAYKNTREFVDFIQETLPSAKMNFVSTELADKGFTPSVFSLDLPAKGNSSAEKEAYKRDLNLKLINMMISQIPGESKHCVSYGQLKGCYWTIPATSTQGTTKEGDKDYIVRVAVSSELDLDLHKKVFADFCKKYIS
jgi:cystathionine beta-lyase/cystathionine gamma-synthase